MAARILITEDDDGVRRLFVRALSADYIVYSADRGDLGLELLQAGEKFDVVITDMTMPGMNGLQMLTTAKEGGHIDESTRVIMASTEGDREDLRKAIETQFNGHFLQKPVLLSELRNLIRSFGLPVRSGDEGQSGR